VNDRHKLWRKVAYDYEQIKKSAPAGYEPTVEVFLVGRVEPVELGFVETRRGDDEPWLRFESSKGLIDEPEPKVRPNDYWVHVHENYVERVEVRLRPAGEERAFGFGHRAVDSPETT
jgi:hypothetical protein